MISGPTSDYWSIDLYTNDLDANYIKLAGLPSALIWYQIALLVVKNKQLEKQKNTPGAGVRNLNHSMIYRVQSCGAFRIILISRNAQLKCALCEMHERAIALFISADLNPLVVKLLLISKVRPSMYHCK